MFNIGSGELLILFIVLFLLFGAKRLPEVARGLGKGLREFKREMQGITDEVNRPDEASSAKPQQDESPKNENPPSGT